MVRQKTWKFNRNTSDFIFHWPSIWCGPGWCAIK